MDLVEGFFLTSPSRFKSPSKPSRSSPLSPSEPSRLPGPKGTCSASGPSSPLGFFVFFDLGSLVFLDLGAALGAAAPDEDSSAEDP